MQYPRQSSHRIIPTALMLMFIISGCAREVKYRATYKEHTLDDCKLPDAKHATEARGESQPKSFNGAMQIKTEKGGNGNLSYRIYFNENCVISCERLRGNALPADVGKSPKCILGPEGHQKHVSITKLGMKIYFDAEWGPGRLSQIHRRRFHIIFSGITAREDGTAECSQFVFDGFNEITEDTSQKICVEEVTKTTPPRFVRTPDGPSFTEGFTTAVCRKTEIRPLNIPLPSNTQDAVAPLQCKQIQ